jgi:flagellar hook capping protein FlgD
MPLPAAPRWRRCLGALLVLSIAPTVLAGVAMAAPTLGFVENWPGTSTQGWNSQAVNVNPGTGGVGGASDGFLRVSTPSPTTHNLGTVSFGAEYNGNWTAAGITQVHVRLNDVGVDDPLEIHFAIGNSTNFWHYDVGFVPPHGQWAEFVVDLSSLGNWQQIIGTGTFAQALQAVDRVHIRHDKPPFMQAPDPLDGDFGIDHLLLTNGTVGVPPVPGVERPLRLSAPAPNPSRGPVMFSLDVYDGGPVRLEIVDAAGRLVRRTELAAAEPGSRTWTWDGRDANGHATPAGVYRVRAMGRSGGMSRGLVRVQ